MLHIIVSESLEARKEKRGALLSGALPDVALDDSSASFDDLLSYAFPSLFFLANPFVHAKFLFEKKEAPILPETIQTLVSSPTIFILEERLVPASEKKLFEKHGAYIYEYKSNAQKKDEGNIFSITGVITLSNKKDRWMLFQKHMQEHSAEALIGILFWKLKQLLETSSPKALYYKKFYTLLMQAQQTAWKGNTPLALLIEKVILEI